MKTAALVTFFALIFLSSCGSDNSDSGQVVHPVDAWSPFVQVLPPGNLWDVRAGEQHNPPPVLRAIAPRHSQDNIETIEIRYSPYNFDELMYLQAQIQDSDVYPVLWWSYIDTSSNRVTVQLFNYSDEEKHFFRQFVLDSPLISFECAFEVHGESFIFATWHYPLPLHNLLDNVTVSAQVQNTSDFVININNEMGRGILFLLHCYLETYIDGRWIPVSNYVSQPRRRFELGNNEMIFCTAHFTRQFDGPFRFSLFFEVSGVGTHYQGRRGFEMHHVTHVFSH